uniref:Uncharacterized protein n=1 Tax=Picea glauca TaxID=3330 RepID=A0A101LXL4_PICGL|nr:hypothetical protein ABT39_MTgene6191 [Picea glauca]
MAKGKKPPPPDPDPDTWFTDTLFSPNIALKPPSYLALYHMYRDAKPPHDTTGSDQRDGG